MLSLAAAAALVCFAAATSPHDDLSTQQCLTEWSDCEELACSGKFSRQCLESFVPWRVAYSRVRCCLRCCLTYWLQTLGLAENFAFNIANASWLFGHPRIDEMLVGFDAEATMIFADYRVSIKGMKQVFVKDRSFEWDDRTRAGERRGGPVLVEASFGDGCGRYSGYDFGAQRQTALRALERDVLPKHHRVVLVSSDDCDAGHDRLMEDPRLVAWFATNPVDWRSKRHPKLRAFPIGVHEKRRLIPFLTGDEAKDRSNLLMCCCMTHAPPPSVDDEKYKNANPRLKALFDDADLLLNRSSYDALFVPKKLLHVSVEALVKRVRRFHVVKQLATHFGDRCETRTRKFEDYASALVDAKFVASPHGNGRACHREWEALAAGAIPLVDYDDSEAMASLYDGLPIIRVKDWREVTPRFLDDAYESLLRDAKRRKVGLTKLFVPYWIKQYTDPLFL